MITERFKNTILTVLKLSDMELLPSMHARQVPGWDSLTHAAVIAALEKEYRIRLKNIEILRCKNLGDLQRLIDSKLVPKK